ncbi:MAG: hypothetical protein ACE5JP_00060 [Candidatus Bipolaricaulia bacterium]
MSPDCRNDCVEPLLFPKRPNNRPGLSHIDYRIGTYSNFREALLRRLNQDPVLAGWTHREADDPGIALLEGASILGDILTFYQELYANEAYLRTAQWRESIADLVRLLGYRLSPGLGGRTTFAFEVKNDKPVMIPAGFPIKAQVEGLEQPADFETIAEVTAYPELSQFSLYRSYYIPNITTGTKSFSIDTAVLEEKNIELNKGDQLLLVIDPSDPLTKWQIVIIEDIQERFDKTEIYIEGSWQEGFVGSQIHAYKLGRSFRHFGYNGPSETVKVEGTQAVTDPVDFSRQVGWVSGAPLIAYIVGSYVPLPHFTSMPLNAEVDDIPVGSTMLVELQLSSFTSGGGAEHFFERRIDQITKASLMWGAVSGGTTVIELDATVSYEDLIYTDIRSVEFLEVIGERFSLQGAYQEVASSDLTTLFYFGTSPVYKQLDGRSLLFVKEDGAHEAIVANIDESSVSFDDDDSEKLYPLYLSEFSEDFSIEDFPLLEDPVVTVYGNLVDATQGKTEKEAVLGNGDSRQMFQTFKLPKAPLTYHNSAGETPPEVPELQIYVNDRLWTRVPSFFDRGPKEEIYIVREDANGESWVQFGDGKTGARLPSGVRNVVAKYRTGTGAYGALKEGTTVQPGDKLDRLDKIQLPGVVSGGSEPESGDNAREAAPGKIQSLDRLVSLKDFESETLAISGVSKVTAAWELVNNVPTVVLTVLMETGRDQEFEAVQEILNGYNKCRGPQRFPIIVHQGKLLYVYIDAVFALDPAFREERVKKAIKETLGVTGEEGNAIDGSAGLFGLRQRRFVQNEYATKIAGIIQDVEGVVWAKVTALGSLGEADDPSELSLPSEPKPLNSAVSCDNDHVLSLYKEHLQLKVATVESMEVC